MRFLKKAELKRMRKRAKEAPSKPGEFYRALSMEYATGSRGVFAGEKTEGAIASPEAQAEDLKRIAAQMEGRP